MYPDKFPNLIKGHRKYPKQHEANAEQWATHLASLKKMGTFHSHAKCEKFLKKVMKAMPIEFKETGSRDNNLLVKFLQCQTKYQSNCAKSKSMYQACHASFMGTGNFNGHTNCGVFLQEWYECIRKT